MIDSSKNKKIFEIKGARKHIFLNAFLCLCLSECVTYVCVSVCSWVRVSCHSVIDLPCVNFTPEKEVFDIFENSKL